MSERKIAAAEARAYRDALNLIMRATEGAMVDSDVAARVHTALGQLLAKMEAAAKRAGMQVKRRQT